MSICIDTFHILVTSWLIALQPCIWLFVCWMYSMRDNERQILNVLDACTFTAQAQESLDCKRCLG